MLEDPSTLGGRIELALYELGMSRETFATELGVTVQTVSLWINNKTKPEASRYPRMAKVLRVDPLFLEHGPQRAAELRAMPGKKPDILEVREPSIPVRGDNVEPPKPRHARVGSKIPIISWVSAGHWQEANDPFAPGSADQWIDPAMNVGPNAFALTVRGDSMAPDFPEGCTIIVDPAVKAKSGDYIIARVDEWDEVTFKRYVIEAGLPYLKPINPSYQTRAAPPGTRIVGVVVRMFLERRFA